jgi:hypothetical protein
MNASLRIASALALLLCISLGGPLEAAGGEAPGTQEPRLQPQTLCPVTGEPVKEDLYVDARGQRIRVCCPACIPIVKQDPEAALSKLEEMGQYAESRQTLCTVSKHGIDRALFVEHEGRRIYACTPPTLEKVRTAPATYAEVLAEMVDGDGDAPEASAPAGETETNEPAPESGETEEENGAERPPQATCPIMGGPINQALYVDASGYRIYYCCGGCRAAIEADPEAALRLIRDNGEQPIPVP